MRYAIYFAAEADDPLMLLGNRWLGRDPFNGSKPDQPSVSGLTDERMRDLTTSPRRYGFHGTLKAPFSLRDGQSEAALTDACRTFAGSVAPFGTTGLSVNRLGRFLALTPAEPDVELNAFAALCVRRFEDFRAPLSEADMERRRKAGLTPKQDAYVRDWGYPYIFDEFRFHMTLSIGLDDETEADGLAAAARDHFAEVTGTPRLCRSFGLYVEPEPGAPFQVRDIFALTGGLSPVEALADMSQNAREETA